MIKLGELFEFKDIKVIVVELFDCICLVIFLVDGVEEYDGEFVGLVVIDEEMVCKVVNYIFEILGGIIYYGVDLYFLNYFVKYGKDYKIDVVINNYGDNLVGI